MEWCVRTNQYSSILGESVPLKLHVDHRRRLQARFVADPQRAREDLDLFFFGGGHDPGFIASYVSELERSSKNGHTLRAVFHIVGTKDEDLWKRLLKVYARDDAKVIAERCAVQRFDALRRQGSVL